MHIVTVHFVQHILAGVKDLPYVRTSLIGVSAQWYNIGVHFRIDTNRLDEIKKKNRRDCDRCLTAMVAEWLKSNSPRTGPPTWRTVVIAIAAQVGGNNPREAEEVAKHYSSTFPSCGFPALPAQYSLIPSSSSLS